MVEVRDAEADQGGLCEWRGEFLGSRRPAERIVALGHDDLGGGHLGLILALFVALLWSTSAMGESVTIPNEFSYGATSSASEVNENFDALEVGVDDNAADINALDAFDVNIPNDFATIQIALNDDAACNRGTGSGGANQGCHVVVSAGKYAESAEIGGTQAQGTAEYQNSIFLEGISAAGTENGAGHQQCAVTLTGDDTADNTVISANNSIGLIIRNLCIDGDEAATNDPKYGLRIGYDVGTTKHVTIDHIAIEDLGVTGGAGIRIGNGASADVPFVTMRKVRMENVPTCLEVASNQAVDLDVDGMECSGSTAAIGGISVVAAGGEVMIDNFFMNPGADGQIGINVHNLATGSLSITRPTFEWSDDNGTFIKFDDDVTNPSTARFRSVTISGGRFQPQIVPTVRHVCISWSRNGTLNVMGNSFESGAAESGAADSRQCEIDLDNPHATRSTFVNWIGNDVDWNGTRTLTVNRTTSGGPLIVFATGASGPFVCRGAGTGITPTSTGCAPVSTMSYGTATPTDGSTACSIGDTYFETDAFKFYACADDATDDWYGVQMVDAP